MCRREGDVAERHERKRRRGVNSDDEGRRRLNRDGWYGDMEKINVEIGPASISRLTKVSGAGNKRGRLCVQRKKEMK